MTRTTRPPLGWLLAVLGLLSAASPADAQFHTWNAPNTGDWSDSLNWNFGSVPASATSTELTFTATGSSSYTATNNIANPFLLKLIALDNAGTGTITIAPAAGGGAITFANIDSEIINFANGAVTIATPVNLAASAFFHGSGTGTVTLTGTVNDGGGGFGLNTFGAATYAFAAAGSSSVNFLRIGSGTTRISAGNWTLASTSATDATAAFVAGRTSGQTGAFQLTSGATLTTPGNMFFGEAAGSTGTGLITGTGTTVTATGASTGFFVVGNNGTGSLTISGGAVVNSRLGFIGRNTGSNGTVVVDGAGSRWANTDTLTVAGSGTGSLTVQGGARVTTASVIVGNGASADGTLTVTGAGSELVASGGGLSTLRGKFVISAGGSVTASSVSVYSLTSAASVVDAGTLTVSGSFTVGNGASGDLRIENGGVVSVGGSTMFVGVGLSSVGTLTVTGANSRLTMPANSFLIFGSGSLSTARGDLTVQNGGAVNSSGTQVTFAQDAGTTSTSVVDAGTLTAANTISIGQGGTATLTVQNGGTITATTVSLASNASGNGTLTVTGAGSSASASGVIRVGGSTLGPGGTAVVNVAAGGSVSAGGLFTLYGGGAANVNGASLSVGGLAHGTAASIGNVNLSNGGTLTITNGLGATYAGVISGVGSVTKTGAGTQAFSAANTYSAGTTINQGTLLVTNTTGSGTGTAGVTVNAGGTLGGTGRVAPSPGPTPLPVLLNGGTVQAGGTAAAAPTSADVLTVTQGLTFDGAASLRSTAGQTGGVGAAGRVALTGGVFNRDTSGAATDELTIRLTNNGTFDLSGGSTYTVTVLTYTGLGAGLTAFTNQADPDHFAVVAENFTFAGTPLISLSGGALSVTFTPVPEPAALLVAAALPLIARRLRRG